MSNTLKIRNTRGTILATVNETSTSKTLSLILHGRGNKNYGGERDENLVHLLENFSNTTPPLNAIEGQLWWDRAVRALFVLDPTTGSPVGSTGSPAWRSVIPPPQGIGFNIIAGEGLIDGGKPVGSPLITIINVARGTGITITADAVSTKDSEIIHDDLSGFVANEHINHSNISLFSGDGLAGGGDLTTSRTLHIGAGTGIISAADDVRVDSSVVRTTGNQTINGVKQWRAPLRGDVTGTDENTPAWSFASDTDTGFYRSAANVLSFTTGGTERFRVESNGVLRSLNTSYETLVTQDDDIPNKKYVDDKPVSSTFPTENIHVGVSTIVGVIAGKKYLVTVYGVQKHRGLNWSFLGKIRVGSGTNPGFGTELASIPSVWKEWIHGQAPVMGSVIVTPITVQLNATVDHISSSDNVSARRIIAIQLD